MCAVKDIPVASNTDTCKENIQKFLSDISPLMILYKALALTPDVMQKYAQGKQLKLENSAKSHCCVEALLLYVVLFPLTLWCYNEKLKDLLLKTFFYGRVIIPAPIHISEVK